MDTGSSVSILTDSMERNIRGAKVSRTHRKVRDYGYNAIKFIGKTILNVKIRNTIKQHTFYVIKRNLSPLFGRDLCKKFHSTVNMIEQSTSNKQCFV